MKIKTLDWHSLKEVVILVVGVLLIVGLYVLNHRTTDLNQKLQDANELVEANGRNSDGGRALVCLQLKAQGQPVLQYEPCMRPAVYQLWKDEPIATLSQRLCETGAKTEGCDAGG